MNLPDPANSSGRSSDSEQITRCSLTFVVAVNDREVLQRNLMASPLFGSNTKYQVLEKSGYPSAALAFNSAIEEAQNDIIIFVHQDVFLPAPWLSGLLESLDYLQRVDPEWGVLGCYGLTKDGRRLGRVYTNKLGVHGEDVKKPEPVVTLDEIVLVVRKSSGLNFDPSLPHFHLYGTDISLSAREMGLGCYVFPGFCIHNANRIQVMPEEFYECYRHIKKRWKRHLPIYCSCMEITRFSADYHSRRIREFFMKLSGGKTRLDNRVDDPSILLNDL